jgi:hypothetical protein
MLHLSLAWLKSSSSSAALLNWSSVWANSWPDKPPTPAAQFKALDAILRQHRALIAGIAA